MKMHIFLSITGILMLVMQNKMVAKQRRCRSNCMDVQANLRLGFSQKNKSGFLML